MLAFLILDVRQSAVKQVNATWLWNTEVITRQGDAAVDFISKEGVQVLFLQIDRTLSEEAYRSFAAKASARGIQVHALAGSPEWARSRNSDEAEAFVAWVRAYNERAKPGEKFTGIQFDVEPYLLEDWKSERREIVREWADNMQEWAEKGREAGLSVGAAVPFWLNDIKFHRDRQREDEPGSRESVPFGQEVVDMMDYVAIMAYRNRAAGIYDAAKPLLDEGDRQKKKVWIGVEFAKTDEGPKVSFHRKSMKTVDRELARLTRLGAAHESFAGIAVHSYEAWQRKVNNR
ncbi:hypothetical protein [Paenibacillus caui]|uniref:hypothetical protein n=1 Tax=Paenibacillus caui TaxID=2873927 RepID=UPI001CA9601B|nr:hypothetical protein [Paenibacillus caui]